ncbi:MAG: spore germination protein [Brevibacillus sp.]|nr:spore germination protein [Brevibacillus sp.]
MFWKMDNQKNTDIQSEGHTALTVEALRHVLANMEDAEFMECETNHDQTITLIYIRTLIDSERLNESIIGPLNRCTDKTIPDCLETSRVSEIAGMSEGVKHLIEGSVLLCDTLQNKWWAVHLENPLGRAIEPSETETVIYGAKDSFTEQLEDNIALIRRRLPTTALKTEKFTVGYLSKTPVVLMYMEGLTNPEFISIAKEKITSIDFDQFLDSSQIAVFMEDHPHTVFPQFLQTDRPDACAYSLGIGKVVLLVGNSPFALVAPSTFFHLFHSPEDYFLRWVTASFFRCIRFFSYFLSVSLIPLYVALTTFHYQMIPLQILFVLTESRSKLPFTPFWEALLTLITLEIIKEASLRMPTKTGQTLGVIGGIVIGEATVAAGFASKVLIVLVGISAIASFLVPTYQMTKSTSIIQFGLLVLSSFLGVLGIVLGMIGMLAHLNGLTSLRQPYFAPVAPFYGKDWNDLFISSPLTWMKTRPGYLRPLQKWRYSRRR